MNELSALGTATTLVVHNVLKQVALRVYAELGAQMTVMYHEEGTKPDRPFEYNQDLLIRPSDFSITRWAGPGESRPVEGYGRPLDWRPPALILAATRQIVPCDSTIKSGQWKLSVPISAPE